MPNPGYCYDPVNATIASELLNVARDPQYDMRTEYNVQYYCYFMTTQDHCETFSDFTGSGSTQSTLCEWDNSKMGIGAAYDPQSSAKCQPKSKTHPEGYCLTSTEACMHRCQRAVL